MRKTVFFFFPLKFWGLFLLSEQCPALVPPLDCSNLLCAGTWFSLTKGVGSLSSILESPLFDLIVILFSWLSFCSVCCPGTLLGCGEGESPVQLCSPSTGVIPGCCSVWDQGVLTGKEKTKQPKPKPDFLVCFIIMVMDLNGESRGRRKFIAL